MIGKDVEPDGGNLIFWHCQVAAMLLNYCPMNPATKHHVRSAVREATKLIRPTYRSVAAAAQREAGQSSGLIREHAIPVSIIVGKVMALCGPWVMVDLTGRTAGFMGDGESGNLNRTPLGGSRSMRAVGMVTAAQIMDVVRELTFCVEITKCEDGRLSGAGLRDRMPDDWDGRNRLARYECADIKLAPDPVLDRIPPTSRTTR